MLKKWLPRIFIALIFLFVALLFTAPAELVERQINSQLSGVTTEGTEGRLWSGKFTRLHYQQLSISEISWDLSAAALVTAKAAANISIDDNLFRGSFFIQQSLAGTSTLSDINAAQSINAIVNDINNNQQRLTSTLRSTLKFAQPSGQLIWKDTALSFDEKTFISASGTLSWPDAIINANAQQYVLGSIKLTLSTEDGKLILSLSSDQQLDLIGAITLDRQFNYQVDISVREDLSTNLYNAVRMLARPNGNGRLTFQRNK